MIKILFQHFWFVIIAMGILNALTLKFRAKKMIAENPELEEGYDMLFRGYLLFPHLPWAVLGIGILIGRVHDVFEVFRPREGNPFVLAFHLTVIALWLLSLIWIFFRGGAEFLIAHPGVFRIEFKSPLALKCVFVICLLGGVVGMILMWNLPILEWSVPLD